MRRGFDFAVNRITRSCWDVTVLHQNFEDLCRDDFVECDMI